MTLGLRTISNFNGPFTGAIDDLRFYNRALSLEEIEVLCSFDFTSDIEENSLVNNPKKVTIYPNPLYGNNIYIENKSGIPIERVLLMDFSSKIVAEVNNSTIPELSNGMYLVKVIFEDHSELTEKILITNK